MKIKIKYSLLFIAIAAFALWNCIKENPISPSATFTTSLTDNHAFAGEPFSVYLKNVKGAYITLFTGEDSSKTYSPGNPNAAGLVIKTDILDMPDSAQVTYSNPGTYTLTLLVVSTGNQSKDIKETLSSIQVTVSDRRNQFTKFTIDKLDGQLSLDGTHIYFYASKAANLTAKKPSFQLSSVNAVASVAGVPQVTGSTVQDFSALNPGDTLGRPVEYVITASNAETRTYTVQYKLRDPYTGKQLNSLTIASVNSVFIPDEVNKTIEIIYVTGTNIKTSKVLATVSIGATANIGSKSVSPTATAVDLTLVANSTLTVKAEDGSTQDYAIIKTAVDKFTGFTFTKANGADLNPAPVGTIDLVNKTITVNVLKGTDVTSLVPDFTGISTFTVQVGANVITAGVTAVDFTNPVVLDLYLGTRKLDSYTVTVVQVSK
jgi:hypothetical protein